MPYKVDFLIVARADANVEDAIAAALQSAIAVGSDEAVEPGDAVQSITRNYVLSRDDGQQIVGFSVDFDAPDELTAGPIIDEFAKALRDTEESVDHVLKLNDPVQRSMHRQLGDQLHVIEMKLREALSLIFIDTYGVDYYTLLRDVAVKPRESIQPDAMREHFENEFYFLLFSDYINLHSRKRPTLDQLCGFIADATDYSTLQRLVAYTPIVHERYVDFLASLQTKLDPIERLRNCVAHNRSISARVMQNYEMAREQLLETINQFLRESSRPVVAAPAAELGDAAAAPPAVVQPQEAPHPDEAGNA